MASEVFMSPYYGAAHMGTAIIFPNRPATVDCMESRGERIRTRRKALGMNQADLAEAVGVDQSTVSDWEKYDAEPKASQLMGIAKALKTSAEFLMTGRDERTWPFTKVDAERFLRLSELDRGFVEGRLEEAIQRCEGGPPPVDPLQVLERHRPPVRKVTSQGKAKRKA
jgi:transcriptional regulator with XRE-family HTH domain